MSCFQVSKVPGGPDERLKLFQEFDAIKESRHASEKGYCPIMNDLIHGLFGAIQQDQLLFYIILKSVINCLQMNAYAKKSSPVRNGAFSWQQFGTV